jgi:hypothetical protein
MDYVATIQPLSGLFGLLYSNYFIEMNNVTSRLLAACLLLVGSGVCRATNTTNILWGGDNIIDSAFLLGSSNGTLFDNNAMVAVGYFNVGFDITANATNRQALYDNFNMLDTGIVGSEPESYYDGFVAGNVSIDTDTEPGSSAVNQVVYYWVLPGVTEYTWDQVKYISEMAIVSDSSWEYGADPGAIPPGTVSGNTYNIATNNLDKIVYGTNGGAGIGAGSNTILTAPVPEPAFYAAGLGVVALLVVRLRRRKAA